MLWQQVIAEDFELLRKAGLEAIRRCAEMESASVLPLFAKAKITSDRR